jgi:formylglycine-generating enzyme required for sulfatase activity
VAAAGADGPDIEALQRRLDQARAAKAAADAKTAADAKAASDRKAAESKAATDAQAKAAEEAKAAAERKAAEAKAAADAKTAAEAKAADAKAAEAKAAEDRRAARATAEAKAAEDRRETEERRAAIRAAADAATEAAAKAAVAGSRPPGGTRAAIAVPPPAPAPSAAPTPAPAAILVPRRPGAAVVAPPAPVDPAIARAAEEKRAAELSAQLVADEAKALVTVPAGHFTMGSGRDEQVQARLPGWTAASERPQHDVKINQFMISKYLVTRAQFAAFVAASHYIPSDAAPDCDQPAGMPDQSKLDWRHPGFEQTDQDPVVCVSYDDAQAYIRWYSQLTGHPYRLPTEAEWEYATRAGTETSRFWGEDLNKQCQYANGADQAFVAKFNVSVYYAAPCADKYLFTSPVGAFQPNPIGLYDMLGDVAQLTADCWHVNYNGAPTDGSAWMSPECRYGVVRGESWYGSDVRSADRAQFTRSDRLSTTGFRLARSL